MKKALWRVCNGEAHSNPMIDHCGVCMPYWGEFPTCPECGRKITKGGEKRAKCRWCTAMVDMTEPRQFKIDEAYKARENRMKLVAALRKEKEQEKPIVESKLDYGDKVTLQACVRDLEMATARIMSALKANNKFTEWECLREALDAVKRVDPEVTRAMFKFVR